MRGLLFQPPSHAGNLTVQATDYVLFPQQQHMHTDTAGTATPEQHCLMLSEHRTKPSTQKICHRLLIKYGLRQFTGIYSV